jgi:signal transduction histidine kinase
MNSLRGRLVAGILAGITAVLAFQGALAFAKMRARLYAEFDRTLLQRAVALKFSVREDKGRIDVGRLDKGPEVLGHEAGVDFFHLYQQDNGLLTASSEGTNTVLPRFAGPPEQAVFRDVLLPGGKKGRAVGLEFNARVDLTKRQKAERLAQGETTEPKGPVFQLVLAKVDTVAPMLAGLQRLFILLWAGCSVGSGIFIYWFVRQRLRPLDQLKCQLGGLRDTVSGQRVFLRQAPAELRPVLDELNRLLERVEAALVRERNLTSSVAHELRTPVAGLLNILEVALSRPRSVQEYHEASKESLDIAARSNWLINNLLSMTRIEAGNVQLHRHLVELEPVLRQWWTPFAARAEARGMRVVWEIEPAAKLETDPEFLRVVVTNLFDNAVSYTPEGGTIRIQSDRPGNILVSNQALGLTAATSARVFDPCWRNDGARESGSHHAGLGLHLCQKIVALLGGRITARVREQDSIFEVSLLMAGSSTLL